VGGLHARHADQRQHRLQRLVYVTNPFAGGRKTIMRVSRKANAQQPGFRYEFEGGFRERFNRGIGVV